MYPKPLFAIREGPPPYRDGPSLIANYQILHSFKELQSLTRGYFTHFSFDTFQGFSLKGVFLRPFLTSVLSDKPFYHFGPSWPEVPYYPGCRSPPRSVRFLTLTLKNRMEAYLWQQSICGIFTRGARKIYSWKSRRKCWKP